MITSQALPTKITLEEVISNYVNFPLLGSSFPMVFNTDDILKFDKDVNRPYADVGYLNLAFHRILKEGRWPRQLEHPGTVAATLAVDLYRLFSLDSGIVGRKNQYLVVFSPEQHDREKAVEVGFDNKSINNYSWMTTVVEEYLEPKVIE